MSIVDVESDTLTVETVNSVTLSQDTKGKHVFYSPRPEVDSGDNLEQPQKRLRFSGDVLSPFESSRCISVVAVSENDPNFDRTMTATTDVANDDLHEETVTRVQILQSGQPDDLSSVGNEEVTPVSQAWFTTKEDKDSLTNKGHKWKKGMWSKEEIDLLMCNIDRYLKARDITDASEIIFEMAKDERKDFYRTIAWGLNRPLFAVYRRVLRMYDDTNHVGKYTPEEIHRLRELRIKHGNDWASIGAALGRSACSVKDRCRLMKETCSRGKWTEDEERRLAEAVHELTGTDAGDAVTQGVAWAAVAERVGSRSEKQCRSKWLNYLNWKQSGGTEWTKEDELTLILRINELGVLDENDINWDILAEGWSSVRSPQWLRSKWWTVKRQIANHKDVTFPVLMKGLRHLHENQNKLSGHLVTEKKYGTGIFSNNLNSGIQHVQIRLTRLEENSNFPQSPVGALQIPVQISHVSSTDSHCGGDADTISLNSGSLQTIELLPSFHLQPTATPGTFLLQTTSSQGIPLTLTASSAMSLTSPTSPDQILLQSLPEEHLLNTSDSPTRHCRSPAISRTVNTDDFASSASQDQLTIHPEYQKDLAGNPNPLESDAFTEEVQQPTHAAGDLSMYGMKEPVTFNGRTNAELLEHLGRKSEAISNPDLKQKDVLHQDLAGDFVTRDLGAPSKEEHHRGSAVGEMALLVPTQHRSIQTRDNIDNHSILPLTSLTDPVL